MNIIQELCSEPAGYAALAGWGLYAVSEAIGANPRLRDNTAIGFIVHAAGALLPVEIKAKPRRRRTAARDEHGRFLPRQPRSGGGHVDSPD
jgi:hypothetical protein